MIHPKRISASQTGTAQGGIRLMNRALAVGLVFAVSCMGIAGCTGQSPDEIYGEGRLWTVPLDPGPGAIPMGTGAVSSELGNVETMLGQALVEDRAGWAIGEWSLANKGGPPLVMAAKLAENRDVQEVNQYLTSVTPWGISGSTWEGNPLGDYDFTEVGLVMLLYLFGDEPTLLYPATVDHIVNVLLIDEGGTPRTQVPNSYGLVTDTENHHLMTEGSRYLKNQWLWQHGATDPNFNNATNGLEAWLLDYLDVMLVEGVYEFNSIPYLGFTVQALLNLDAFAESAALSVKARYVLDTINWQYALGSLDLRRCAPFRRQLDYAGQTELYADPHTTMMRVWTSDPYDPNLPLPPANIHRSSRGFIAEMLPYRLPDDVTQWVLDKPSEYFVRFGRGPSASPEIYSGGPGWLLSAGGVYRGPRSIIAARPITLMLSDGSMDLLDCFHMPDQSGAVAAATADSSEDSDDTTNTIHLPISSGDGSSAPVDSNASESWMEWNNTGVHRRFACCNGPVGIPSQYAPAAQSGNWQVFAPDPNVLVAVYSQADLGLIAVFPDWSGTAAELAMGIVAANPTEAVLRRVFNWPSTDTITYDVGAAKGAWVIETVNGQPVDRNYDGWPHVDGGPTGISFDRPGSSPIMDPAHGLALGADSGSEVPPLSAGSGMGTPIEFTVDASASSLTFSATVPEGPNDSDSSAVVGTIVARLAPLGAPNSIHITDMNLELSDGIGLFYLFDPIAAVTITGDPQDPFGLLLGHGDGLYAPYGSPGQAADLDPSGSFTQGGNVVELKGTALISPVGMLEPLMNPTEELRDTGPYDLDLSGTLVFTSPNEVRLTLVFDAVAPIIDDPILIEGQVTGTVVANAVIPEYTTLSLRVVNERWGTVDINPNQLEYLDPNTIVTLTAQPDEDRVFKRWKVFDPNHPGDANHMATDGNNPLHLQMDADWEVVAVFGCGSDVGEILPLSIVGLGLFGLIGRRLGRRR